MKKPLKLKKLDERIMNILFMVFCERKEDTKKDKVLLGLVRKMKL